MCIASTATTLPTLIVMAVPWPKDTTVANPGEGTKTSKREKEEREESRKGAF